MRAPLIVATALAVLGTGVALVEIVPGGGGTAASTVSSTAAPASASPSAVSTAAGAWTSSVFSEALPASSQAAGAAPATAGFVTDLVTDYRTDYGAVGINQLPIWTIGPRQATVAVSVTPGCNDFRSDTGADIPIPAAATTSGTGDSPLIIYQPSTHTDWELWQAKPLANGGWTACFGGKLVTSSSDGVFAPPWGLSGSGISYLATTITEADVASGAIRHAIAVDLPRCNAPAAAPANRTDCGDDPGQPPEGTRFRLSPALRMPSGLTPFAKMVFVALQTYGMVVTDKAGGVEVQTETQADWQAQGQSGIDPITTSWRGKAEYQVLQGIPWADLQVVNAP